MRHGTSGRRHRNRNNGRRGNQQRAQVYDSNGPDVRIRGTAHQVAEKYLTLAKDAASAGDVVVAENYYQHAEHYIRIIGENNGTFDAAKVLGSKSQDLSEGDKKPEKNVEEKKTEDLGLPDTILGPEVSVEAPEEEVAD